MNPPNHPLSGYACGSGAHKDVHKALTSAKKARKNSSSKTHFVQAAIKTSEFK